MTVLVFIFTSTIEIVTDRGLSEARKRSSSRGSSRSRSEQKETKQVHLQDCEHLIREKWVNLPGGFTKAGSPLLIFPDVAQFHCLHVTDLHTLLQYYINVVPRSEQVGPVKCPARLHSSSAFQSPGFAIIIDRREACWQEIQKAFSKIVSVFPGKIKEVFLLYKYPDGKKIFLTLTQTMRDESVVEQSCDPSSNLQPAKLCLASSQSLDQLGRERWI